MTPWLRTLGLGTGGLLLVLGTAPAPVSYASSAPPAASYAVEPLPAESRAGSGAGVGRQRPGRQAVPGEEAPGIRTEMDPGVPEVPDIPVAPETDVDVGVRPDVVPEPSRHA